MTDPMARSSLQLSLDLNDFPASAVALSGGSDSMALLHLAVAHGVTHAVTVDHGLRDVTSELELAAQACAQLGVQHHILRWQWDGLGNLQSQARDARRDLLREWAQTNRIGAILLGHTADDQAETVLLRLARGSGIDGLAGMEAISRNQDILWLRPMLDLGREELRNWLRGQGIAWADDPSNDNPRFDRVKVRQMMAALGDLGLSQTRLVQLADHAQAARGVLQQAAQNYVALNACERAGALHLPQEIMAQKTDTERRVLAAAVQWAGRSSYRPRWQGLQTALSRVRLEGHAPLAGAVLRLVDGKVWIMRDFACARTVGWSRDQSNMTWDDWCISGPQNPSLHVGPLGKDLRQFPDWRATGLPREVLQCSPAIWVNNCLQGAPILQFGPWKAEKSAHFDAI